MANLKSILGETFVRLTVIGDLGIRTDASGNRRHWWRCRCECGSTIEILQASLTTGHSKSCGCLNKEVVTNRNLVHGHSRSGGRQSRSYQVWSSMIQRCTNQKSSAWGNYGGRGITVCAAWLEFPAFLRDMGDPPRGATLERVDNDRGYSPDNCCWTTRKEQARNMRTNRLLTFSGETKCVAEWAEKLRVNPHTLYNRLGKGWSVERALTEPVNESKRRH